MTRDCPLSVDVAIVGGGAAGTLVAQALVSAGAAPGSVCLVDPSRRPGPGLAYGAAEPYHLLNNVADRMSVRAGDELDLVRWAGARGMDLGPKDFAPRRVYGEYLSERLAALVDGPAGVVHVADRVVDVEEQAGGGRLLLGAGGSIETRTVVLALGTPPPAVPAEWADAPGLVRDPWVPGALDLPRGSSVLLVGTGLTSVDVAMTLTRRDPTVRLVATSRHGLLPEVHAARHAGHGPGVGHRPRALRTLVAEVRRQLRAAEEDGRDWRPVVDGLRPALGDLWAGMDAADRDRFLRHLARRWEVRRHRMAPQVAAELERLRERGTLRIEPGLGPDATLDHDATVLGTGPRSVAAPGWNPLVDALLRRGLVRSDPHGLGLDLAAGWARRASGATVPWLRAIGQARRGERWESTAVPEIRLHAAWLAEELVAARSRVPVGPLDGLGAGDGNRTRTVSLGS